MKTFVSAVLVLAVACGSAFAQKRAGFHANVPFAFAIGSQSFPAGTYEFQRPLGKPSVGAEVGMIAVRSLDGSSYRAVMTALASPSASQHSDTKIVFKKRAGEWQLSQVWIGGDTQAQQLPKIVQGTDAVVASGESEVAIAELR